MTKCSICNIELSTGDSVVMNVDDNSVTHLYCHKIQRKLENKLYSKERVVR